MKIPKHVGLIMDGNGRWAKNRGHERTEGHLVGFRHMLDVIYICLDKGITFISPYLWSTENWKRPQNEINFIMGLMETFGPYIAKQLHSKNVRIVHSGHRIGLSKAVQDVMDFAEELTINNGPQTVNFVFNYGGRDECVRAVKKIIDKDVSPENININTFKNFLDISDLPDIDLVIRSGGDYRLSNFMLWQSAYAVICVIESFWPEINDEDIQFALKKYNQAVS